MEWRIQKAYLYRLNRLKRLKRLNAFSQKTHISQRHIYYNNINFILLYIRYATF